MFYPTHICRLAGFVALSSVATTASADADLSDYKALATLNAAVHNVAASSCLIAGELADEAEMHSLAAARNSAIGSVAVLETRFGEDTLGYDWAAIDEAASMILAGDTPGGYFDRIIAEQVDLEGQLLLARDAAAEDVLSNPAFTTMTLLTMDVAARQQIVLADMKLSMCLMQKDAPSADLQAALTDSITLYENSLAALTLGASAMGIAEPNGFAAHQVLAAASFDWQATKPALVALAVDGGATDVKIEGLRNRLDGLDDRMAELTELYFVPTPEAEIGAVAALN